MFDCATALAASVVSYFDPESKAISPPRWEKERELHKSTVEFVRQGLEIEVAEAWSISPSVPSFFRGVLSSIKDALERPGMPVNQATIVASRVLSETRLLFAMQKFDANSASPSKRRSDHPGKVSVIIPFRATVPHDGRLRNLLSCLRVLTRQSAGAVSIVVVEDDEIPRNRGALEHYDIQYHHRLNTGKFNKSAAINFGSSICRSDDGILCILDGDAYLDETFVDQSIGCLIESGCKVLFPYTDMYFIQPEDTGRIYEKGFRSACPIFGYVSKNAPGGCVWLFQETFDAVGGFDAGFVGWGGEDRDFFSRVEAIEKIARLPGIFAHLYHERAPEIKISMNSGKPWENDYRASAT